VTRFERALERVDGETTVAVRIHPFQLDPNAPVPGIPALQRYAQKFGAQARAMLQRVQDEGAKDGLELRFDRAISANTFDAHRALRFAADSGKERELEMSLYRAYFTDGLDISDRSVLADRAAGAGLDRSDVLAYLESEAKVAELREELREALELGITGVPAFVFEQKYLVPGAVPTETFVQILERFRKTS
jgi:predicted DsbA family dithiol-disulfide isomerase